MAREVYEHVERLPLEFRNVVKAVDVFGLSYAPGRRHAPDPAGHRDVPPLTRPPPPRLRDELEAVEQGKYCWASVTSAAPSPLPCDP